MLTPRDISHLTVEEKTKIGTFFGHIHGLIGGPGIYDTIDHLIVTGGPAAVLKFMTRFQAKAVAAGNWTDAQLTELQKALDALK